jgi:hypothetical protein
MSLWNGKNGLGAIVLAAVACLTAGASAVPGTLTQQGRLFSSDGDPVDGEVTIIFTIYDDPDDSDEANVLWTESQDITLDDGYFSAQLGEVEEIDPDDVFDGSVRYLGVTVGSDSEMSPRQAITSVPYAFHSGHATQADDANHADEADEVPCGGISGFPSLCASGSVLSGFSAAGEAECASPSLNCSTYSRYVVTSSSTSISCGSTNSGEVDTTPYPILLVGGCYSYSSAETFYRIYPSGNTFYCYKAGSTAAIRAYAKCCRLD